MTTFLNRLKVYAIGFGIGLILVFFFFQNRGCSWLPENRVKNSILDRVLVLSETEAAKFSANGISDSALILLLNDGDVDFKKSQKDGKSKVYFISNDTDAAFFTLPYESFISEVKFVSSKAKEIQNTKTGSGKFLRFPLDEDLIFVDTLPKLGCQQQAIGMINQRMILKSLKNNGQIDFGKSALQATPKAEHYLWFTDVKNQRIGAKTVWYKNKITIHSFDLPIESGCN
jgi:hypothetical protein